MIWGEAGFDRLLKSRDADRTPMNALLSGGASRRSDPHMQSRLEGIPRGHAGCGRCGPNTDDVVRSKTYPEFFFRPYRHPDTVETMPEGPG